MAGRRRCEQTATKKTSRRGDAASSAIAEDSDCTTPVCQATSKPDLELARLRQAEEGRISPTAGRRTRESSPTASRYFLRNTRARTCWRVTQVGPGVRLATSPAKARATRTGSGHDVSYSDRRRDGNSGSVPSSACVKNQLRIFHEFWVVQSMPNCSNYPEISKQTHKIISHEFGVEVQPSQTA